MSIQDKISALEAEIAAERRAAEHSTRASKNENEVLTLLSSPNFPEAEKQRILAKMRAFGSKV